MLGTLCRELDAHGAVAALCSRRRRYLLRKTAVLLGRNTEAQGKVGGRWGMACALRCAGHSSTIFWLHGGAVNRGIPYAQHVQAAAGPQQSLRAVHSGGE